MAHNPRIDVVAAAERRLEKKTKGKKKTAKEIELENLLMKLTGRGRKKK